MTNTNHATTVREFWQSEFIDTKLISQDFIDRYYGKTTGRQPNDISLRTVGDLSFTFNGRRPKAPKIKEYIEKQNGLNWYLFGACQIAKIGPVEDMWDALYRSMICCTVLGPDANVPAIITEFDVGEEIHYAFWNVNGGSMKKVSPEQVFIAQIKSQVPTPQSRSINEILKLTDDVVVFEDKEIFEPNNNSYAWNINVGPMKQMLLDIKDENLITDALDIYKNTFEHLYPSARPKKIQGQIVTALAFILKVNIDFFATSTKGKDNLEHFTDWLTLRSAVAVSLDKNWQYKNYMHDRMEKRYLGTANGIWEDFCIYFKAQISAGASAPSWGKVREPYMASVKRANGGDV